MFFLLQKRQISNKGFQKLFDCIVHDLLLAKLGAYGFDYNSLELINSFLCGRKFGTKKIYSCSQITIMGVAEGSIYGHFFIYICMRNLYPCDLLI